jgi:DNA-binding MarR family transcriptional regulator
MAKREKEEREPLKSFRNLMTFRLHRLGNASQRFSEEYYKRLTGLSLIECRLIGILSELGTATFKHICELARLDKSFGSRVIQRLADQGILDKDENPADQRSVMLRLTPKGARLQNELYAAGRVLNREMMSTLSPQQARDFMTCLLLISDRLDELEEEGFEAKGQTTAADRREPARSERAPAQAGDMRLDSATVRKLHQLLGQILDD